MTTTNAALHATPLTFVLLVFALSVPFLLISAVTGLQLLPGIPVAGLAFVCPALAAALDWLLGAYGQQLGSLDEAVALVGPGSGISASPGLLDARGPALARALAARGLD